MRQMENDKDRQQSTDERSVFSISPCSGEFQPDASFEFDVMSSPTQVREMGLIPSFKQSVHNGQFQLLPKLFSGQEELNLLSQLDKASQSW